MVIWWLIDICYSSLRSEARALKLGLLDFSGIEFMRSREQVRILFWLRVYSISRVPVPHKDRRTPCLESDIRELIIDSQIASLEGDPGK